MSAQPEHQIPDPAKLDVRPARRDVDLDLPAIELAWCPACDHPTEILDRFELRSTGGPLEYVKIRCLFGHGFLMPAALLGEPGVG